MNNLKLLEQSWTNKFSKRFWKNDRFFWEKILSNSFFIQIVYFLNNRFFKQTFEKTIFFTERTIFTEQTILPNDHSARKRKNIRKMNDNFENERNQYFFERLKSNRTKWVVHETMNERNEKSRTRPSLETAW